MRRMKKEVEKILKKAVVFLIVMSMCAPLVFTTKSVAAKGYYFKYAGVTVTMGSKAKKLIKAAGKPLAMKKKKSCAFKGYDRTRQYTDFILYTYTNSKKGAEYVNGITFRTSSVKTKEGIGIGSSKQDVMNTYGTKNPNDLGIVIYSKGKTKLFIKIDNNKVSQLRFVLK